RRINQINLKLNKLNLWNLYQSGELKKLLTNMYDIFIDMNEAQNTLSIYISRKLNAPVQVCMAPSQHRASFNLIYNYGETASYNDKLRAYIAFIQQFIN
ncbi:hypothetical protein JW979_12830, partial [bacterium]|nr:hypothetical protein [candidate division CSSED10-310 bacterium]